VDNNLTFTYDGSAKSATATTTPAGLNVAFTYNGSSAIPTVAGQLRSGGYHKRGQLPGERKRYAEHFASQLATSPAVVTRLSATH